MSGEYLGSKIYKLRKVRNGRDQYEWLLNIPKIFVLRNRFPEKVKVEIYEDKLIVTPA